MSIRIKDLRFKLRYQLAKNKLLSSVYSFIKIKFIAYSSINALFNSNKSKLQRLVKLKKGGKNVLLATSMGSELVAWRLESILSIALMQRDHNVEFAINDGILPACQDCTYEKYKNDIESIKQNNKFIHKCKHSFIESSKAFQNIGINVNAFSSGINEDDLSKIEEIYNNTPVDQISGFKLNTIAIGEHAMAGALRFFAKATLDDEPIAEIILKSYFKAALITAFSFRNILKKRKIDVVVLHHGIYVPQGIICSVAKQMGVRVVAWNIAYRKNRFIFSHDDTYHHTLINEPISKWDSINWSEEKNDRLLAYLQSRWFGDDDWINFNQENPNPKNIKVYDDLGLDKDKPCIAMLTNVLWDAQLHYPANAFENMLEWIYSTINYFIEKSDIQLVIRVHPAEETGRIKSRQRVANEIQKKFPNLPSNIKVIEPKDNISSYDVVKVSNCALIFGTKMGVELSASGKPVIVAGEAWIRGKGLTMDASTKIDYIEKLQQLPLKNQLSENQKNKAKLYAFHFFFRRMIPTIAVKQKSGWPPYDIALTSIDELMPGKDQGLDIICSGITNGTDFIYDESDK